MEEQLRSLVSLPPTMSAGLSGLQSGAGGALFLILFELHLSPLALTLALTDAHSATVHKSSHLQVLSFLGWEMMVERWNPMAGSTEQPGMWGNMAKPRTARLLGCVMAIAMWI